MSDADLIARITELEQAFDVLMNHMEDLTARVADDSRAGGGDLPAWTGSLPEADTLHAWVAWFNDVGYGPVQSGDRIPDCWEQHPGMVAELLTLWHSWQNAFVNPAAEPEAAQNWHDRWLPGTLHRISRWAPSRCREGGHDRAGTAAWTPPRRGGAR